MNTKELLDIKYEIKARKPDFLRQDANRLSKLKKRWRRPKGLHSKMRRNIKGHRRCVSISYSTPKELRGTDRTGLRSVVISNVNELLKIRNEGIIISKKVGLKNRVKILKKIKELNLKVLNVKDSEGIIKMVEDRIKKSKELKGKREEKKKKSKEESLRKSDEKKTKEVIEKDEKDKKDIEKEEKRKVLEMRE